MDQENDLEKGKKNKGYPGNEVPSLYRKRAGTFGSYAEIWKKSVSDLQTGL